MHHSIIFFKSLFKSIYAIQIAFMGTFSRFSFSQCWLKALQAKAMFGTAPPWQIVTISVNKQNGYEHLISQLHLLKKACVKYCTARAVQRAHPHNNHILKHDTGRLKKHLPFGDNKASKGPFGWRDRRVGSRMELLIGCSSQWNASCDRKRYRTTRHKRHEIQ